MPTTEILISALVIFGLRVLNSGIGTLRLIVVTRGQRMLSAIMAFVEALTFAYAIAIVSNNLTNVWNLAAYCGGFSVGAYLAMVLESRLIRSFVSINIIAKTRGHEIAEALRAAGFGVTETEGEGRDGVVTILRSIVISRDVSRAVTIVRDTQEDAFIAVEPALTVYRGYMGGRTTQL
jgi:uncharacterized protein YebE (UPF0316 family)